MMSQPSMFAPEELPYPEMVVRLDLQLDGPRGRCVTWVTISEGVTGGQLACWSTPAVRLDSMPDSVTEILADALKLAMRQLAPF